MTSRPRPEPACAGPQTRRADDLRQARVAAMDLLARREHSRVELKRKLGNRHFDQDVVDEVLAALADEGLLDDARYAEAFVRSRIGRGQGPQRIRMELRERGVDEAMIDEVIDPRDSEWLEHIAAVRRKRFGDAMPDSWPERARQMRFLQYRGFDADMIRRLLDNGGD